MYPNKYLTEEKRLRSNIDKIKRNRENARQAYEVWDMRLNLKTWELQNFLNYKKGNKKK